MSIRAAGFALLAAALCVSANAQIPGFENLVPIPDFDDFNPDPTKLHNPSNSPVGAIVKALPGNDPFKSILEQGLKAGDVSVEKLGNGALYRIGADTKVLQDGAGKIFKFVERSSEDSLQVGIDFAKGAKAFHENTWKEGKKQEKKLTKEVTDAGKAIDRWRVRQERLDMAAVKGGATNLSKGAPIDEMWNDAMEHSRSSDKNLARATQESAVLNGVAQAAATAYGGPAGAAAYAAWSTYHATGDVNMAIRQGILSAITSQTGGNVNSMPTGTLGEAMKKSVLAGTMGGIAVAASGGDQQDVEKAFFRSAGSVLIQYSNDVAKSYSPETMEGAATLKCISARDYECLSETQWVRDASGRLKTSVENMPVVQKVNAATKEAAEWVGEKRNAAESKKQELIRRVSMLPDSEAIPVFKDKWVLTTAFGKAGPIEDGQPMVVLTYVGKNPAFATKASYGTKKPSWDEQNKRVIRYKCEVDKKWRWVTVWQTKPHVKPKECTVYLRIYGEKESRLLAKRTSASPKPCLDAAEDFKKKELSKKVCVPD